MDARRAKSIARRDASAACSTAAPRNGIVFSEDEDEDEDEDDEDEDDEDDGDVSVRRP